jgi:hypothetical protein
MKARIRGPKERNAKAKAPPWPPPEHDLPGLRTLERLSCPQAPPGGDAVTQLELFNIDPRPRAAQPF